MKRTRTYIFYLRLVPLIATTCFICWTTAFADVTVTPSALDFGTAVVNNNAAPLLVTLSNNGPQSVKIVTASSSLSEFVMTGPTMPIVLSDGDSVTFLVNFRPDAAQIFSGALTFLQASQGTKNDPIIVLLTGAGAYASLPQPNSGDLGISTTNVAFGGVPVGSSSTQTVILTNTGNNNVTLYQVNVSGVSFSTSGITTPLTLSAGQSTALTIVFAPVSAGSVTGSITVVSDAMNSPATIALSGTSLQPTSHQVALTWNPSTSVVVGYNVYRSTQSGGPYTELNSSPVLVDTYTDKTVLASQTYFYVLTAVDAGGVESGFSNEVQATVPSS
jgi:hypothetical protein